MSKSLPNEKAEEQPMRAILIINPTSGKDPSNADKVASIQDWLANAPFTTEVAYTTLERGAGVLAKEAVAAGVEVVLVGGGDGTVSEVARHLVHTPSTLGILPIGTFNNIARSIGVLADLPFATSVIAAGHVQHIDVGLANESEYFFEAAGAGLDAALFPFGEEIKEGRWSRILHALDLAIRFRPQRFSITFDRPLGEILPPERKRRMTARSLAKRTIQRKALLVVAANGPYYGGGFTVAAGARMHDGYLTLSIFQRFSKWQLLRHFYSIFRGRYRYSPKIETFNVHAVEIASRHPVPVHRDGNELGGTPVTFRALPGALRVFVPSPSAIPRLGSDL